MTTAKLKTITPAQAAAWLGLDELTIARLQKHMLEQCLNRDPRHFLQGVGISLDDQRQINRRKVYKILVALEQGRWDPNFASIRISSKGLCTDGQHRLVAIVLHGKPVACLVQENAPRVADISWNLSNWLASYATPSANQVAGAYTWFAAMERSQAQDETRWPTPENGPDPKGDCDRIFEDRPPVRLLDRLLDGVRFVRTCPQFHGGSVLAGLHAYLHHIAPTSAAAFFAGLENLTLCSEGDVREALSRRLIRLASDEDSQTPEQTASTVVIAWNAYLEGRDLSKVQKPRLVTRTSRSGGTYQEREFPRVVVRRRSHVQAAAKAKG